jgi:pimeloyl-ACP methyl ester carboxylesterase
MASKYYSWIHGNVHYDKRGMGDPLVLVHNIYPGASWEEYERNVQALARQFTVYSLDLLGFGGSDRPRYFYRAETYAELVFDFLREVIEGSAYVVASGLSAAYVARAVTWEDEWFRKLVLICPRSEPTGLEVPRWFAPVQRLLMTVPPTGASGYYETMTSDYALREFLLRSFYHTREATEERVQRLQDLARRPGSNFPYASLMTGYLDMSILEILPKVDVPVMLLWGRQARPSPVGHGVRLAAVTRRGRLETIEEAGAWVHAEQSAKVNTLIADFCNGGESERLGQSFQK